MGNMKKYHWWKCQSCGLEYNVTHSKESKQCPLCKDKGCKDYRGCYTVHDFKYAHMRLRSIAGKKEDQSD